MSLCRVAVMGKTPETPQIVDDIAVKKNFCPNPEKGELTSDIKIVESVRRLFWLAGLAQKLNCMVYKGILFLSFFFNDFNTC